ncbi:MAG TPA: hypothetical protein VFU04_09685 [Solirubrobacterales bacterium]|nr:hypothetical protein [Solirubrobacterales bacterium]
MTKRKGNVNKKGAEILDPRLAKALANSLRVEILAVLSHRRISPVGYVREFGGKLPSVAYHFKVLEAYDCIELAETLKRRGALEHVYRCSKRPLLGDGDWKLLPLAVRGGISGAILQTLIERSRRAIEEGTFDAREDRHFTWTPLQVDERGWKEATRLLASTLAKLDKIEARSSERLSRSGKEPVPTTVALACFESPADNPA